MLKVLDKASILFLLPPLGNFLLWCPLGLGPGRFLGLLLLGDGLGHLLLDSLGLDLLGGDCLLDPQGLLGLVIALLLGSGLCRGHLGAVLVVVVRRRVGRYLSVEYWEGLLYPDNHPDLKGQ